MSVALLVVVLVVAAVGLVVLVVVGAVLLLAARPTRVPPGSPQVDGGSDRDEA